jgi:hypothetical protein
MQQQSSKHSTFLSRMTDRFSMEKLREGSTGRWLRT